MNDLGVIGLIRGTNATPAIVLVLHHTPVAVQDHHAEDGLAVVHAPMTEADPRKAVGQIALLTGM